MRLRAGGPAAADGSGGNGGNGGSSTLAWPLVAVTTVRGSVHGYLMADLRCRYQPLERLLAPAGRQEQLPGSSWATALRAAAGLASLLAALHAEAYLVGDLKPDNLWVDEWGGIGIADVDSWQFTDHGQLFACRMHTPGYTAPEAVADPRTALTEAADDFVLAVLVHQLLLVGLHPFAGRPADGSRYVSLDDNLLHGRCRLIDRQSVVFTRPLPPFDLLPGRLAELFRSAFGPTGRRSPGQRPSAATWARALRAELADGRLRGCAENRRHVHSVERPWCPWCDLARRGHEEYPEEPVDAPPNRPAGQASRPTNTNTARRVK